MAVQSRERLGDAVSLVQADAENLPFCSCTFDLLVSTSTLQWLDRLDRFFNECYRVMKPDSLLCIAFFGGTTLWELQECYRHVIERCASGSERLLNRLHTFKDTHEIRQALEQSAFETVLLTSEIETEYYADLPELLRSIKNIGAGSHNKGGGGLGWRRVLNDISALYREKYHTDGGIPASYEVLYITARKRCN
jgi:malonyl-CoA O-methyltransferase